MYSMGILMVYAIEFGLKIDELLSAETFCCQNNHTIISIIKTEYFTILINLTLRAPPTTAHFL